MKAAFSWHWIDRLGDETGQFLHWLCYGVCSRSSIKKEMLVLGVILAFYLLSLQDIFITRTTNLRFDGVAMYGGYHYFIEALLYNFLPLWNPYQHGGEPFYYGWSMLLVLNPSILLFVVGAKILQPFIDLSIYDLYHYNYLVNMLLLWLGTYLLARRVLRHPLSVYIALMAMTFGSFTGWLLSSHTTLGSFVWIPWVLYFLIRVMDHGKAFDLLALAYFAGITIGASNYHFVYGLFFGTVFLCTLLFTHRGRLWRPFISQKKMTLLGAVALLLMLSAPLLSLWVDFDKIYVTFRNPLEGKLVVSLTSKAVSYGSWSWIGNISSVIGIMTTGLALIGATAGRNRFKWNLLVTFAITILVFLGPKTPFFQIIYDLFLPLRLQRAYGGFSSFIVLCLALLAGIGVDALVSLVIRRTRGAGPEDTADKYNERGSPGRRWLIFSRVGALTSAVKSHARRLLGIVVEGALRRLPGAKNPRGQRRLILFGFSTILGLLVLHWLGVRYSPLAVLLVLVATVSLTRIGEGALYRLPGAKSPEGQRRLIFFGFSTIIGLLILYWQGVGPSPLNVLLVLMTTASLTHVVHKVPWGWGRYIGALLIVLALWAIHAFGPFRDSGTLILLLSLLVLGAVGIAYYTRNTRIDLGQRFLLLLALAVFVDLTMLSSMWASGRYLSLSPIKEELAFFDVHAARPEFISRRISRAPSRMTDSQNPPYYQHQNPPYYQYYQFLPVLSKRVTAVDGTLPLKDGSESSYVMAYGGREDILQVGWVWMKTYLQVYAIGERSLLTFENLMGLSGDRPILDFYPRAVVKSEDEIAEFMEKPYQELSPILDSAVVLSEHLDAPFQQLEVESADIKSVEAKPQFTYKVVSYNPNHIEMDVEVGSDGLLLFRDGYDDYWKATVDGMPQTVYKANVMFKAIPLKEGMHRVVFDYRPVFFLWALALYLIGNALFIAYFAYHSLSRFWPSKSASHDSPQR